VTETKSQKSKFTLTVVGLIVSWALTCAGLIWSTASAHAEYSLKISRIEKELISLDERLDIAESFRMEIKTDLAQIKTDLLWIRRALEQD
tara:strand:- start:1154 stop:1423 length:270 start_codon:yes stop_codon:yes gene_type:complete